MDNKNSIEQLYAYVKDCYDGEIRCRVFEDRVVVATSIFLEGYDESVCNAFCFSTDGRVIINDGGSVADYREVTYADDKFDTDEIKKIMADYDLEFDGKHFTAVCDFDAACLKTAVRRFLAAIDLLSKSPA